MDTSVLERLLKSKSPQAQLAGATIALLFFAPTVFRVSGDEALTIWQRLEQVSVAAGQTLLTVAAAALPAEAIAGSLSAKPSSTTTTDDSEPL